MSLYLRPTRTEEALERLAAAPLTVLAGGTDHYPARVGKPLAEDILDITALDALRGVRETKESWRIGATTSWSQLIEAKLPPAFDALKQAAREVGGAQIQNSGTVAGNVCNASPAADGVPPLLALDARVELASTQGTRSLRLDEYILGPRRTARRADELLTAILVPKPSNAARSRFLKLGARRYLVISIAMVAAVIETEGDRVAAARVAVGACSPVAQRLPALEQALAGVALDEILGSRVRAEHLAALAPIDDPRGSARYRNEAAQTLIARCLNELGAQA
ncbi:MAG: FAD binding domain-containing protein [Betaproteobacteria bacterium]|nr:FAD binding domain-containing protein [Betaproteobacteria bacterium]